MTRTTVESRCCNSCRYWSEMIARANHFHGVEAICLNGQSPKSGAYTTPHDACADWVHGPTGAVDDPGGNPYEEQAT